MMHRIRTAMQTGSIEKLSGNVEVDETFIGGAAKNMHRAKREAKIKGRGSVGKTAVMGLLERKGRVMAKVIANTTRETLHGEIKDKVEQGANLFTDEWRTYSMLWLMNTLTKSSTIALNTFAAMSILTVLKTFGRY